MFFKKILFSFNLFSLFSCLFFLLPFILHFNFSSFTSLVFQITNYSWSSNFYFFIQIFYFLSYYYYLKSYTSPFPGLKPFHHFPELYHYCGKLICPHTILTSSPVGSLKSLFLLHLTSHKHSSFLSAHILFPLL